MHPRVHFLCCDFLDAHEVCVLTLGTGHCARLHFFAWVYSQFAKKNLVVYAFSFDQCLWIIIDGKWVLAATEFDLGGDRIIILFPLGASQWIIFVSTVNWHRTFRWVALYGLSTGSHLITEVKSCWAGSISRLVTILVSLCCMPGEVRLGLCSTLVPPSSGKIGRASCRERV